MKVHLVCKRFYTNKDLLTDRFGRLYHLPVELQSLGAEVSVSAIDYRHSRAERLVAGGVPFDTVPASAAALPGLIPALHRAVRASQPDILIASGDSHIGFAGLCFARRMNAKFVFDVYDYYPAFTGNRIPGMKAMFRHAVKHADLVLCPSHALLDRLGAINPAVVLVENGVDRIVFAPGSMHEARKAIGIGDDARVIGYFGSLTPTRGPLLIEACRMLRDEIPSLRLLLAGHINNVSVDAPWITYLGERPQQEIPQLINSCDVVTIPYAMDAFNSMAGACKMAEYLACEKPVVATRESSHGTPRDERGVMFCKPDPNDLANAIRRQLDEQRIAPFPKRMDWGQIAGKLLELLQALPR